MQNYKDPTKIQDTQKYGTKRFWSYYFKMFVGFWDFLGVGIKQVFRNRIMLVRIQECWIHGIHARLKALLFACHSVFLTKLLERGIYYMLSFYASRILLSIEEWVSHTYLIRDCILSNSFSIKKLINSWERKHNNKIIEIHGNFFKYPFNAGYKCLYISHILSKIHWE